MNLPGYEILEELGRGGMGVVYKARQVHLNRLVALKMILDGERARNEDLARFRIEAQAAARLDHPNIVRIFDFGEHGGLPYYSMELVAGSRPLRDWTRKPWPIDAAVRCIHTLARAMHHAHEHHVVHRDLKPANILVARAAAGPLSPDSPVFKITDFGLAKQLDSNLGLTDTGRILGTVQYMSPEQASGAIREIGPTTDIHALGLILYELLTGRVAFDGTTILQVLEQVRTQEPIPPAIFRSGLSPAVESICLRCLQKAPQRRYTSAEELASNLESTLRESVEADTQQPSTPDTDHRSAWWRQ